MANAPGDEVFRGLSLLSECSSSAQLLGHGLTMVTSSSWLPAEPAAAFTCLASGVERLLKLTYGLATEAGGGSFPSDQRLRKLGHDLEALDKLVTTDLLAATSAPYIQRLLQEVDRDPYWPLLLSALNSWAAASGRYRDLRVLSGASAKDEPAWVYWEAAEHQVANDLGLFRDLGGAGAAKALGQVRDRMALSVMHWWHSLYRAWQHELAGAKGIQVSTEIAPDHCRYLDKRLAALVAQR